MRWRGEHVARRKDKRSAYMLLVGNKKKRRLGRWEDNIETDLRQIGWEA
jgi:hypothetical protein